MEAKPELNQVESNKNLFTFLKVYVSNTLGNIYFASFC